MDWNEWEALAFQQDRKFQKHQRHGGDDPDPLSMEHSRSEEPCFNGLEASGESGSIGTCAFRTGAALCAAWRIPLPLGGDCWPDCLSPCSPRAISGQCWKEKSNSENTCPITSAFPCATLVMALAHVATVLMFN